MANATAPDLRLPSQPHGITASRPVADYTAWWLASRIGSGSVPIHLAQCCCRWSTSWTLFGTTCPRLSRDRGTAGSRTRDLLTRKSNAITTHYATWPLFVVRRKKSKSSPYSTAERMVPELIPVLGSQPPGDVSHKPGGRLPLLSATSAVTLATIKRAATNFAAW